VDALPTQQFQIRLLLRAIGLSDRQIATRAVRDRDKEARYCCSNRPAGLNDRESLSLALLLAAHTNALESIKLKRTVADGGSRSRKLHCQHSAEAGLALYDALICLWSFG